MNQMLATCPGQTPTGSGQLFTSFIQLLAASQCNISPPDMWPEDATYKLLPEYDFIVVGAGSAGCVVASRLSEVPHWNVLLIEAGGDPPVMSEVPALADYMINSEEYDWQYLSEPSATHSLGLSNGQQLWTRAKVLGGCSAHNGMVYIRGNRKDYDDWEREGNPGWGYDEVLQYFKKSENLLIPEVLKSDRGRFHGVGGELKVDNFVYSYSTDYFVDALKEMDYDFVEDINGEENVGYMVFPATVDGARRCSSAKAFLTKKKKNLHVVKNSHVTKILINEISRKAEGVEFINNNLERYHVKATKEVVVSAGTINTPQLLMLSGIGPANELKSHGISFFTDLPVGQNLQDHFGLSFSIRLKPNGSATNSDFDLYTYLMHQTGPLASNGASRFGARINTKNRFSKFPNLEILNVVYKKGDKDSIKSAFSLYPDDYTSGILKENERSDVLKITVMILNPKSVGEIKLRSSNPLDKPRIYPNHLSETEDLETLVEAARIVNKLIASKAMQRQGAELIELSIRNCRKFPFNTDDYWRCVIRNFGLACYHPTGTAKMGPSNRTAVVDSKLQVHGIRNLRIADCSIMPRIVTANTNAPAIMIGEKAAAMIRQDWL